jgi:hypothetical protein
VIIQQQRAILGGFSFLNKTSNSITMIKQFKFLLTAIVFAAFSVSSFGQAGDNLPPFDRGIFMTATTPVNGTDEVQTITIGGTPTAGSFTLTYAGRTTGAIAWSSTNATLVSNIDTALEALTTIGTGGVTTAVGTMTAGIGTITVTFVGNNAKLDVPVMTGVNSMTGTSPTLAVATTTPGVTADGRSQAKRGTMIVTLTGVAYINTSATLLNPTWVTVGSQ